MQLVLIAELCKSPDILLIDEVTSVLDVYGRQFYLNLFREFISQKNGTIFLTTNIITEVSPFIDHIFVIKNGKLAFNGEKEKISNIVWRLDKKWSGDVGKDSLDLSEYFLIDTKDKSRYPQELLSQATTEDLFLFLYRQKNTGVLNAKAS